MDIQEIAQTMTKQEKAMAHKRLMEPPSPWIGFKITFFFDDEDERCKHLRALTTIGIPPHVGAKISIRNYTRQPDKDADFGDFYRFIVKDVIYPIVAAGDAKEKLIHGDIISYQAEVMLVVDNEFHNG